MIKTIDQIKNKPVSFIKEFINNCTIEEKIDTHYVIVEITSKNSITIKKSNGKPIDRIDMILNNMWIQLITDWNYIRLVNQDLFMNNIGYNISMFYFPSVKPLNTEYKNGIKYLIDRITLNDISQNTEQFINKIKLKDKFNIYIKKYIEKQSNLADILNNINSTNKNNLDYNNIFLSLIKSENNKLSVNKPEGYIFKNKKNLYQLLFNIPNKIYTEKTSYEFLLCDFITYCKNNNYQEKIQQSYIKTVCSLFNDYIVNWEEKNHNIENNIEINSLQAPTNGEQYDIGYEYIPDIITQNICKNNLLYKNIFKILLANLRRGKDNNRCIYMNKNQINDWNIIMKNIKVRTRIN